ncbi:CAP domain-containing protein [Companilactobacillus musae]|uniref:CAP domain-containing protein n=1 Tax=Companilactobacillus musae TaxID=1903258 RepID=UPI000E6593A3|nr:CAP domain-containing protein [Companilactobacillus musae]
MNLFTKKSAAVIAALAMATTGALMTQTKADAATVATVNAGVTARLYTDQGSLITNRALAPSTPWAVGKMISINGETYYQVATNEYLKETDATLNGTAVGTITNGDAPVYYTMTKGDMPHSKSLANGTQWQVESANKDVNGNVYYEVAPNEWISSKNMTVSGPVKTTNVNFVFTDFANLGLESLQNQNNNNNQVNTNNQPSNNQNTTNTGDAASVAEAVFQSINAERASKGIAPLTQSSDLTNTAAIRAKEISTKFDHERPDGTMCFTAFPASSVEEENIAERPAASATGVASSIMDAFRAENFTPSHYTNVLSTEVTTVGIGVVYDAGSNVYYVAEDFIG